MADQKTTEETNAMTIDERFDIINARVDSSEFQVANKKRIATLKAARDFYDGYHPQSLKVRAKDKDPNVIINFCRKIVNASVAWLFGDPEEGEIIKMELPVEQQGEIEQAQGADTAEDTTPDDDTPTDEKNPNAQAQAYLEQVYHDNGGPLFFQKLGRRASIGGHGFVKIVPKDDEGNELGQHRLVLLKSESICVVTKEDDTDTAEAYVIEWCQTRMIGASKREVQMRQIIAHVDDAWWTGEFAKTGRGRRKWIPTSPPEEWPFKWSPIVDWQSLPNDDDYYGLSDLEDLTGLNVAINFTATNVNRILYIHGHPRTVGTGFEASELQDTAVDSFWTVPSKDAKITLLEMVSDLKSAFAFLQFLTQSFWDIGRDIDLSSLRDRIGQITNFGLRVLSNNAIQKLGEKRLTYGGAINRINRALLELGGLPVQDTVIHWKNPLPEDALEDVQRLQGEMDMEIVSRETAAEERGRDWKTEEPRIEEDRAKRAELGAQLIDSFESGKTFKPLRKGAKGAGQRKQNQNGQQKPPAQE